MGLDLRGRRGQPAYAAAAGRVTLTGRFVYQGNAVYVDHGFGVVTAYFHFSSIDVEEGDIVEAGQVIGRVGSTGRSTAPHLHWSAYVHGVNVDPESLIGFRLTPEDSAADDVDEETRNH
jgi:murein DD-endopeptidase MepM/ murein hydrolase activator NlpD